MRIISIDIETTGLNPNKSQILQIGAVIFDTNTSTFQTYGTYNKVIFHKEIYGDPFAIQMNSEIIKKIALNGQRYFYLSNKIANATQQEDVKEYLKEFNELENIGKTINDIAFDFFNFIITNGGYYINEKQKREFNITGKNFWAFDNNFLEKLPNWSFLPHRRSFDPSNLYFNLTDKVLPSLTECKERCIELLKDEEDEEVRNLFTSSVVTHDALDDAMDVAKLVWYKFYRERKLSR